MEGCPLRSTSATLPVTNPSPARLRLHVEDLPDEQPALTPPEILPLLTAFEQATGWQLRHETCPLSLGEAWSTSIDRGDGQPAGRLVLSPPESGSDAGQASVAIELQPARRLALALGNML